MADICDILEGMAKALMDTAEAAGDNPVGVCYLIAYDSLIKAVFYLRTAREIESGGSE